MGGYTYSDAYRLLGGRSKFLEALEKLTGAALVASAIVAPTPFLSLFGIKGEAFRAGDALVDLTRKKFKAGDSSRTEVLTAAHAVMVMSAFFKCIDKVGIPASLEELDLSKREQLYLSTNLLSETRGTLVRTMANSAIPSPSPVKPYEELRSEVRDLYSSMTVRLGSFISGLEKSEEFGDEQWFRLREGLDLLAERAIDEYDDQFRMLAVEFPDFLFMANLYNHQATREELRTLSGLYRSQMSSILERYEDVKTGLSALAKVLEASDVGSREYARSALAIAAADELDWPIVDRRVVSARSDLNFPALADSYINPSGRVAKIDLGVVPGDENWWTQTQYVDDLQLLFASLAYSTEYPSVVMGQPGSGKSLMTKVLTARLSEAGFLALRVELRHVQPNVPIQLQIEEGIYRTTGERTTWPDLVRTAGLETPRVVLLDGLDELIQNSSVMRSDYLLQVQEFQQRESSMNRATSVIVTSRTVVAMRTLFPDESIVVKLEPFVDQQIERWLDNWSRCNSKYFSERRLSALDVGTAVRQGDLARQPLLLLMLALYDSDDNELQRRQGSIESSSLYLDLLDRFARREVLSRDPNARRSTEEELRIRSEAELHKLAIVALGMFCRGRQYAGIDDIRQDFSILVRSRELSQNRQTFSDEQGEAENAVGGFFFIYESKRKGERDWRTYEFLHPTFGEFLVARYVVQIVDADSKHCQFAQASSGAQIRPDVSALYSALSFHLLTSRLTIVRFMQEIAQELPTEDRSLMLRATASALQDSLISTPAVGAMNDFRPESLGMVERAAVYSANLMIIALLVADRAIPAGELLGSIPASGESMGDRWSRYAGLWRSQLFNKPGYATISHSIVCREVNSDAKSSLVFEWATTTGGSPEAETLL